MQRPMHMAWFGALGIKLWRQIDHKNEVLQ